MRILAYKDAISEALVQAMGRYANVFVIGEGVDDLTGIFGTTLAAHKKFPERVLDMPLSEELITGVGTGAALAGMRPVMVHARNDFLMEAMDQIVNHLTQWAYIHCEVKIPVVIRAIIGRGWGNGAQHSQSLQALFAHIPRLKVVMPATPYRAKGLLIAAIEDDLPVIFIEHRSLYHLEESVPEEYYSLVLDKAVVQKEGSDLTMVAVSFMVAEAVKAAAILEKKGIDVEIIDVSSVKPLDEKLIFQSVKKTKRAIVLDTGWKSFGVSAEISAVINEELFGELKSPVLRIALPDLPIPASYALEKLYYPSVKDIVNTVLDLFGKEHMTLEEIQKIEKGGFFFQGPF
jgi:pyruvate/2-oxoglutarate/acetoin dehydrogenase E1 component